MTDLLQVAAICNRQVMDQGWGISELYAGAHYGLGGHIKGSTFGTNEDASLISELAEVKVKAPGDMYVIADGTTDGNWDATIYPRRPASYPSNRHYGYCQVLFADSHVEKTKQGDMVNIFNGNDAKPYLRRRWNNDNMPH